MAEIVDFSDWPGYQGPNLTPIEGFVVSIFRKHPTLEWAYTGPPVFAYKADLEAPVELIDLRDHPDLFESLPNRTYRATAAARKLYLSLPRPF